MQTSDSTTNRRRAPWTWVPSLYFVQGIPFAVVNTVALLMYKRLGLSDTECALYSSWLSLPWVLKPLWSPFVELFKDNRWWIVTMQTLIAVALGGIAFTLPTSFFFQSTLALFFLIAFTSATHDIAADGYYMIALSEHQQALNVGVRSLFYRIGSLFGEGALLILVGMLEVYTRKPAVAWSWIFMILGILFSILMLYHRFILPSVDTSSLVQASEGSLRKNLRQVGHTFLSFIRKPHALTAISFMLLYRLPEAILTKISPLFLNSNISVGGLGLSTQEIGFVKGTVGTIGIIVGGIIGGVVVARDGFRRWRWPMVMAISLPNIFYVLLAYYQPHNLLWINLAIFVEQFGYGFGFTLYMLFLLYYSQGESKTAHYALCTGFMALSLMLPGLVAGWISDHLGYYRSFLLVMALVPITFWIASRIHVPDDFGRKK